MRRKIEELMLQVADLPIFEKTATLFEVLLGIGMLRKKNPSDGLRYPGVLVSDGDRNIVGFLDFRNMLKGLEPRYFEMAESVEKSGFPPGWVRSELEKYGLHGNALDQLCKKTGDTTILELMTVPGAKEITDSDASVNEVIYQMVVTGNDFLFVRSGNLLVGVINISDILTYICDVVKGCRI